jgi:hypothetical protein
MENTSVAGGVSAPLAAGSWISVIRTWMPLTAVVLSFFILSSAYNARVPLYEAPDEAAHAYYAGYILENGELPEFKNIEEYESWQPPLYYSVGAATLKLLQLEAPVTLAVNPDFHFPQPGTNYIHSEEEDFPYNEPVMAVHTLRLVNTVFSMATLVFIYLSALALFPGRRLLATTAAASAGFLPQFAFISGMVSNDPAATCFSVAAVFCGVKFMRDESPTWVFAAALAVSLGALSKVGGVLGGVVPVGAILLCAQPWTTKGKYLAIMALLPLLLAGWFFVRSIVLWGAVFPHDRFWPFNASPPWEENYADLFFQDVRRAFWFVGGPMLLRMAPLVYDILDFIAALGLAGLFLAFKSGALSVVQKRAAALIGLVCLAAFLMVIYHNITADFTTQGRYLFPAMSGFAIFIPLGLSALFARDTQRDHAAMLVLPAVLILVNVGIFITLLPSIY